jgi:D-sedoheptulose 7-phosphate isomerase
MVDNYIVTYLEGAKKVTASLDVATIRKAVEILKSVKKAGGRIFMLGVGGGAANASHAVNDFRKICGMEAYSVTDNVAELTARVNDEGWDSVFTKWLITSRLSKKDCLFIFSVGGGNREKNISSNLVFALEYARRIKARIIGIVGRDGGYTAKVADAAIIVPQVDPKMVTPLTESFQAVIWHLLVTHPLLKSCEMKWESVKAR